MTARFAAGSRVRVRSGEPSGHCRTPGYLRGKTGTIVCLHGSFRDPEKLAYHKPGLPRQPLYSVYFDYDEVWPGHDCAGATSICADIFQHWLEPAA
jgi:nitrile hydratase subunit beta